MRILEKLLIRRQDHPQFSNLPLRVRKRLAHACQELSDAEAEMARLIGLPEPPRLLMVDEEQASIIFPDERPQAQEPAENAFAGDDGVARGK